MLEIEQPEGLQQPHLEMVDLVVPEVAEEFRVIPAPAVVATNPVAAVIFPVTEGDGV